MAIGRTFQESMQKALRGLEVGASGLDPKTRVDAPDDLRQVIHEITTPGAERVWHLGDAFRAGLTLEEVFEYSHVDPGSSRRSKTSCSRSAASKGQSLALSTRAGFVV